MLPVFLYILFSSFDHPQPSGNLAQDQVNLQWSSNWKHLPPIAPFFGVLFICPKFWDPAIPCQCGLCLFGRSLLFVHTCFLKASNIVEGCRLFLENVDASSMAFLISIEIEKRLLYINVCRHLFKHSNPLETYLAPSI